MTRETEISMLGQLFTLWSDGWQQPGPTAAEQSAAKAASNALGDLNRLYAKGRRLRAGTAASIKRVADAESALKESKEQLENNEAALKENIIAEIECAAKRAALLAKAGQVEAPLPLPRVNVDVPEDVMAAAVGKLQRLEADARAQVEGVSAVPASGTATPGGEGDRARSRSPARPTQQQLDQKAEFETIAKEAAAKIAAFASTKATIDALLKDAETLSAKLEHLSL